MALAVTPQLLDGRTAADQWQLAYHEAGHSVVLRALGVRIVQVSIAPNADDHTSGCFHHDLIPVRHVPTMLMAGIVAERLHAGVEPPPPGARGWIFEAIFLHAPDYGLYGPDIRQVTHLAQQHQVTSQDYIAQGARRARAIFQKPNHWRAVAALATALNKCSELTGEEATGIITRALKSRR